MKILLSKNPKLSKQCIVVGQNEDDIKVLRILFNNSIIRGAYSFWPGNTELPKEMEPLKKFNPVCCMSIGMSTPIEDITKDERRERFIESMEKEKTEKIGKDSLDSLNFLEKL